MARLVELLDDESDDMRASAVASLLSQYRRGLEPSLQRALDTLEQSVGATPGWATKVDALAPLVRSDDEQVRAAAIKVARALSAHPDEEVRRRAGLVLSWAEPRSR